jgi:hypothetical protein
MVKAVTTKCEGPSPQSGEGRTPNPGENLVTTPVTVSGNTTHTHTLATAQGVSVCVNEENLSAIDVKVEVGNLIAAFVRRNDGTPAGITSKQREQLVELLKQHGCDKFRGAANAWLKEQPWDSRTTHPFVAFINGFEGFAAKIVYDKKRVDEKKRNEENAPALNEFQRRKAITGYGLAVVYKGSDWYKSLTPEDLDYVAKVGAANSLAEMPPDNGKNYSEDEIQFRLKQEEQEQEAIRKAIADGDF